MTKQKLNSAERRAYRELFINRDDVYKRQNSRGDAYYDVHETLTDEILFNPNENVGSYQLDKNNQVRYAVLDIDIIKEIHKRDGFKVGDWLPKLQQQVKCANDLLKAKGIEAVIEFSGFKGYHLWIFLKEPMDASVVRQFMKTTFDGMKKVDAAIEWELFPKQDNIAEGYGNYIKPPLQLHKKSGRWSHFVDENGNEITVDLTKVRKIDPSLLLKVLPALAQKAPATEEKLKPDYSIPPPNMENMLEKCAMLRNIISEAEANKLTGTVGHEKRLVMASLLKPFGERGYHKLIETLKHVSDFNEPKTKKHWDSLNRAPVRCDTYCKEFPCNEIHRLNGKSPIKLAYVTEAQLPANFVERNNCYFKKEKSRSGYSERQISTFIIEPKELLVLKDSDCLRCDVKSAMGYNYDNVQLENADWHTRIKILKAIGHQDCTFTGSDNDLQALCSYVNYRIPVRKRGSRIIGLIDGIWVINGINIDASGINHKPEIIPYEKGADAFYNKIGYKMLDQDNYNILINSFYRDIEMINSPEVILPILGWFYASPLKDLIAARLDGFPILFVHGGQGSGKTTTGRLLLRLAGYNDTKPNSCTMRSFPMLKLLASTNAVPVLLDEFKVSDMSSEQLENLTRYMRKSYYGEIEQKGRADQTVEEYNLSAPMIVMGEWNISQPALKERFILVRFTDVVKKSDPMQQAYERIKALDLEGFMPNYVHFCLEQKLDDLIAHAASIVNTHFESVTIAPRIRNNLIIMIVGLLLYQKFAAQYQIKINDINFGKLLNSQLANITDSNAGFVRSAVDQLIEELNVMAMNGEIVNGYDYKLLTVENKIKALAINFNKILPRFKEHARRTQYEGELLDKSSYYSLFKETPYVINHNMTVKYADKSYRSLVIDIGKATEVGITLEGFQNMGEIK